MDRVADIAGGFVADTSVAVAEDIAVAVAADIAVGIAVASPGSPWFAAAEAAV